MAQDLPKAYIASEVEDAIYAAWETSGVFNPDQLPDRNQNGEPYCIMMPPPNVTGVLHLGHALENAIMDTMVRFERMRGKKALLIPGTDHAAVATQAKVEKVLMEGGMKNPRQELGREGLLREIRAFSDKSQATILSQVKKMGTSCDWSRLAFTFDEARSRAVNELFCSMYRDGLIYRGYRVVNWSVKGQSTCSDDELAYVDRPSKLYTFKYSKDFPITIATTRPETKLGDTAVAVHPNDERYQQYIGQTFNVDVGAQAPLQIKIIADEGVEKGFGTGALGVTPAHSAVDFAMYEKQKAQGTPIGLVSVIGTDGKMTEAAGSGYVGLSVEVAREKFVQWLRDEQLLEKEEDITQSVGTSDRFGDVIESLPLTQWWLDVNKVIPGRGRSLKDLMREAVTDGLEGNAEARVSILPERYQKLYLDRIEHLRDWCLSRQIWWGHRIPVWYKSIENKEGQEIRVGIESPGEGWEQDPDTLDTWFSSGAWTFSTLGWPEKTKDLAFFHPTQWMTMGYEIVYLWLMRMILMSAYALKQVPFKNAYIHGILRDEAGKKFSKSSGNNLDPLTIIQTHGCDALRWSVMIGTTPGNDSRFYEEKVDDARNLVNKLWNISRYILTLPLTKATSLRSGTDGREQEGVPALPATLADTWMQSRLQQVIVSVTDKLETYQFSAAGEELRDFTWSDLADWYLEIAKVETGKSERLREILQTILKLWHPFVPFVTEHIWKIAGFPGDLIVAEWPTASREIKNDVQAFERLRVLVTDIRRLRAEQKIEPAKAVEFVVVGAGKETESINENLAWIQRLVNASSLQFVDVSPQDWPSTVSGSLSVAMNMAGLVDVAAEREKAKKELAELEKYIVSTQQKLENQEFVGKAPERVVEGMRQKLEEAKKKAEVLTKKANAG
ncbi:valine--tRNA ligase [Patescibacteria group bacterium]|nr:valine--tRNA ligase [Patescibacteria group bacterium]MBP9709969.1 valine--tRNA ligase [Patescibacteria group bacterium]